MKNDFEIVFKENLILDEKSFRNNIEMRYDFTLKHYFRKWSLKSFRFILTGREKYYGNDGPPYTTFGIFGQNRNFVDDFLKKG